MANDYIETTAGSGGPKLDTRKVTVGANQNLHRQVVVLGGQSAESTTDCVPAAADPGASDYAIPTRIVGQVAHDAVDIGSPVKIGGWCNDGGLALDVTDGDRVNAWFLNKGELVTAGVPFFTGTARGSGEGPRFMGRASVDSVALSNSATTLVAAGGSGIYIYLVSIALTSSGTAAIKLRRVTGSTVILSAQMVAGVPFVLKAQPGLLLCVSGANDAIEVFTAANVTVSAHANYIISSNALL